MCRPHVCLLGLVFRGVCSAEWLRLGQLTSSELVCDLLFWAEGSAKVKFTVSVRRRKKKYRRETDGGDFSSIH